MKARSAWVYAGCGAGLLAALVLARGQTAPATQGVVRVDTLINDAIKDIDGFSKRLDGKTLTLEGKVREIRESHVVLVGISQKDGNGDSVDCAFTEEKPEMLAQIKALKVGMTVRITGEFLAATLMITSPTIDFYMCSDLKVVAGPATATAPATASGPAGTGPARAPAAVK